MAVLDMVFDYAAQKWVDATRLDVWHDLSSSNVTAFKYDSELHVLTIEFHGGNIPGRQYRYDNILQDTVDSLVATSSPGRWVNSNLRNAGRRL